MHHLRSTSFVQKKGVRRTLLLFVGDDHNFTKEIDLAGLVRSHFGNLHTTDTTKNGVTQNFSSVHYPQPLSRGADICFVANHCDTILLSSTGSTFGFWMAYLGRKAIVYCNALLTKSSADMNPVTGISDEDLIPAEWIRLRIDNGTASEELGGGASTIAEILVNPTTCFLSILWP